MSAVFCDRVTGKTRQDRDPLFSRVGRLGARLDDTYSEVVCDSHARWKVGTLYACDRDLVAVIERAGPPVLVEQVGG